MFVLCLISASEVSVAADQNPAKISSPTKSVKVLSADCYLTCALSAFLAPDVIRKGSAAILLLNGGTTTITLKPRFLPTNGLAESLPDLLKLSDLTIEPGQTKSLPFSAPTGLSAGLYTGELIFADGDKRDVLDIPMEIGVRGAAVWAVLVAFFGIVVGRISQLIYDPKVIARLQLLDWLNDIERNLEGVNDAASRGNLQLRLDSLRRKLGARSGDAAVLQPDVKALDDDVEAARAAASQPSGATFAPQSAPPRSGGTPVPLRVLRWLSGVSPIPIQQTYDWLMPVAVLLALIVLTFVFVWQQYGGSGAAEVFGSGGLADYAPLFLAGFASESIVSGLKTVKLK